MMGVCFDLTDLDDGDGAMFLVHPPDVSAEVQSLLIVAIPDTGLHHLWDLQHLQ